MDDILELFETTRKFSEKQKGLIGVEPVFSSGEFRNIVFYWRDGNFGEPYDEFAHFSNLQEAISFISGFEKRDADRKALIHKKF